MADILKRDFEAEQRASTADAPDALSGAFAPDAVDDTDDPARFDEELLAWRLRELQRVRDERAERDRWDREQAELARVRALSEDERRALDAEKLAEWQAQPQTQYRYLQKYYHKGAFFQDAYGELMARDYAAPTANDTANKDALPEHMQVRGFGRKGRSKWTHLTAEDTTAFDYGWGAKDNAITARTVSKMGGMRGDLEHPSKRSRK